MSEHIEKKNIKDNMSLSSVKAFCDDNNISYKSYTFPRYKQKDANGNKLKNIMGFERWNKFTNEQGNRLIGEDLLFRETDQHIVIDTHDYVHIDVDWLDDYNPPQNDLDQYLELKAKYPYCRSYSKKKWGVHFWVPNMIGAPRRDYNKTTIRDIEVLAGVNPQVMSMSQFLDDKSMENVDKHCALYKFRPADWVPQSKSQMTTIQPNTQQPVDDTVVSALLGILGSCDLSNYGDWMNFTLAMKHLGLEEEWVAISKHNGNYDEIKNDEHWNNIADSPNPNKGLSMLKKYAKKMDPAAYCDKIKPMMKMTLLETFYQKEYENWRVNHYDGEIEIYGYSPPKQVWFREARNNPHRLRYRVLEVMVPILKDKIKGIEDFYRDALLNCENDNEKKNIKNEMKNDEGLKEAKRQLAGIQKYGPEVDRFANFFIDKLTTNTVKNTKFDSIPHKYHFENICFNLHTSQLEKRVKEDYCSIYAPPIDLKRDDKKIETVQKLIVSIFPDTEVRNNYIQIMCNAFSGKLLERFVVANGSGGNGKGLWHGFNHKLHGDYAYTGNASSLCKEADDGGNPAIAMMSGKRFSVFSEPDEKREICFSMVKRITGDAEINARALYSNKTDCQMCGIKLVECNKKLKLNGDTGDSMGRRLLDFLFGQRFKTADRQTPGDGSQTADPVFKTPEWQEEHRSSLFYFYLDFMKEHKLNFDNLDKIDVCGAVKARSQQYIESSNDLLSMILEVAERTDNATDYSTCKEIYNAIKCLPAFSSMPKSDKNRYFSTYKKFWESAKGDAQLMDYYREKHQPSENGKQITRNKVLVKFKLLPEDSGSDSDCDTNCLLG